MYYRIHHYSETKGHHHTNFPLVINPHNVRFSHTHMHLLYFSVARYPRKELIQYLTKEEGQEITITKAYISACVSIQATRLNFLVKYQIKKPVRKDTHEVTEKEARFRIDATKEEIISLVDPSIEEFRTTSSKATAESIIQRYNIWAHPVTLEALAETLTEDQKLKAAQILQAYFAA